MLRAAIVESGIVTNVISVPDLNFTPSAGALVEVPSKLGVGIGWLYDGEDFTAPIVIPPDYPAIDLAELNSVLASQGSVVRALAILTFEEINKLRDNAGLAQYMLNQFKNALIAEMRDA